MEKTDEKKPRLKMSSGMPVINPYCGGIDVGDTEHHVALPDGKGGHLVWTFGCFTEDLQAILKLLRENGITTVAMEATGVYYVSLFLMLEEAGIEPFLVNARHVKNVSGRKSDDSDAIWIQKLHACGLLQKSFQPTSEDRSLRDYVRHRKNLVNLNSDSVRRMQKALELMNLKIHTVISDILGKTGMQIIAEILKGERDPNLLAKLRDSRIQASEEDIIKSLNGIWKPEYLFMLQQAYEDYYFHLNQIKVCEEKIREQLIKNIACIKDGDVSDVIQLTDGKKKHKKNQFDPPIKPLLIALTGIDLCAIPGVEEVTVLELISETGTDMSKWKTVKHFSAWLNVAPNTKATGGKIKGTKMMKKKNRAGQTLRMAASGLSRSNSSLGQYSRRMKGKLGGKGAVVATANKLSRIIYTMLRDKKEFDPNQVFQDQEKFKTIKIKQLEKQLAKLKKEVSKVA